MNSEISPEERELDARLASIYNAIKDHSRPDDIDLSICDDLRQIQSLSLFKAPKDEEGEDQFDTYDAFADWVIKDVRRKLREEPDKSLLKTGYKRINEALVYNRLAGVVTGPLPSRRAQLQALEKCHEEKQVRVWETTVSQAGEDKITGPMIIRIAQMLGERIPDPAPSASSVLAKVKAAWKRLRIEITDIPSVSSSINYIKLDELLAGKGNHDALGAGMGSVDYPLEVELPNQTSEGIVHTNAQQSEVGDHTGRETVPKADRGEPLELPMIEPALQGLQTSSASDEGCAAGLVKQNNIDRLRETEAVLDSQPPASLGLQPLEQSRDGGLRTPPSLTSHEAVAEHVEISASRTAFKFASSTIYLSVAHKLGLRELGFTFKGGEWKCTLKDSAAAKAMNDAISRMRDAGLSIKEAA